MSGAGENRSWRRSGQAPRQNQDRSSGTNTPNRDAGRQQAMSTLSGNAWASEKAKGTRDNQTRSAPAPPAQADTHVPVNGFNAAEVKDFLKKRYLESIGDQPVAAFHKVQGDSVAKRSSGAWGSRGNMSHLMPSGQDFFTQLKKQLHTLDGKRA